MPTITLTLQRRHENQQRIVDDAVRFNVLTADDKLNAQIQDKISTTRRFAFEEQDAPVIEAQQRIIDAALTPVDPVILAIDVGPVRYKQILQKLIAAEQAQP